MQIMTYLLLESCSNNTQPNSYSATYNDGYEQVLNDFN